MVDRLEFATAKCVTRIVQFRIETRLSSGCVNFLRFNYMTRSQAAHLVGVRLRASIRGFRVKVGHGLLHDSSPFSALCRRSGQASGRPGTSIGNTRTGEGFRSRGVVLFVNRRKGRGAFQGVCPSCGATGPKRVSEDRALSAWNGKDAR